MSDDTYVLYIQGSGYITGMPTRDMTQEEWETYPESWRTMGLNADIYRLVRPAQKEIDQ